MFSALWLIIKVTIIGFIGFVIYTIYFAKRGNANAQYRMGYFYFNYGDHTKALEWLNMAVKQDNAAAMEIIGRMYEYGRGVSKNQEEAEKWYRMAAERGNSDAKWKIDKIEEEKAEAIEAAKRRNMLIGKYGDKVAQDIFKGKIWVGMTTEQLLYSRGKPSNISDGSERQIYRYGKNVGDRGGVTYKLEITVKNDIVKSWKEN